MSTANGAGLRRVVVGVDGSEQSEWALRWAVLLAGPQAEIVAATAWEYPPTYGAPLAPPGDWRPEADAEKTLQQTVDRVFGPHRPVRLALTVQQGHAAGVLVRLTRDADLLIVGSRGHGGFSGVLLGAVSDKCVHHAKCSVFVAHQPPPPSAGES